MLCAVYVTYTMRGKVYRDRIAYNLLAADAEALARECQAGNYDSVTIEDYPAGFTARW